MCNLSLHIHVPKVEEGVEMDDRIEQEVMIEAPLETVWRVVTEPEHIVRWWADDVSLDVRPGGEGLFVFARNGSAERKTVRVQVEDVDEPRRLAFRWAHPEGVAAAPGNSTFVEFSLIPEGERTRLRVVESGMAELHWSVQERDDYTADHRRGWSHYAELLRDYGAQHAGVVAGR